MKRLLIHRLPDRLYLSLRWWDYRLNRHPQHMEAQNLRKLETVDGASYLPFDEKKAIFVHIPKCGGISVNLALFGNLAGGHTTLDHYINIFEPRAFQNYFKFTFIRNPWDRVVSAYHFLQAGGMNKWDKAFYDRELADFPDFRTFVLEWLSPRNIYKHHHFKPQYGYLFDRYYKVTVDYIGQLENIEAHFQVIGERIGSTTSLSKENRSSRGSFREYYDDQTREKVEQVYAADIALLGYTFDGRCECPTRIEPITARHIIQSVQSD